MTDQETAQTPEETGRTVDPAAGQARPERKPWSKPVLTVRAIDEVTLGTKASTKTDGPNNYFS